MSRNRLYPNYDCGEYFFRDSDELVKRVVNDLVNYGFSNHSQVNKYYAYAFAVDFVRFEHYSKMQSKKLVDWGGNERKVNNSSSLHRKGSNKPAVDIGNENSVPARKQQIIVAILGDDDHSDRLLYREDYLDDSLPYGKYLPFLP